MTGLIPIKHLENFSASQLSCIFLRSGRFVRRFNSILLAEVAHSVCESPGVYISEKLSDVKNNNMFQQANAMLE
jgi:hypothetical protein